MLIEVRPPGTGKTSLSLALAGYFRLELYLCHLPSIREDKNLEALFSSLPPRCIVLLEDIDAVGTSRKGKFDGGPGGEEEGDNSDSDDSDDSDSPSYDRSRVTLSGLLNVLDGVSSQEGRIVLMTSNMAHSLDKALVRPGRIDKMIFLGNISPRSAELMFLRMYAPDDHSDVPNNGLLSDSKSAEELQELALEFSSFIPDNLFTPAQLQGFLLNKRNSATAAAREVKEWAENEKKILDLAKKKAKDALTHKNKKRKNRALEKLAKTLKKAAEDEKSDAKDEQETEDELAKLAKAAERKRERKEAPIGDDEKTKLPDEAGGEKKDREPASASEEDKKTILSEVLEERNEPADGKKTIDTPPSNSTSG